MIISPPFLPERDANQTDETWMDAAMAAPPSRLADTHAPEGSFPLSHNLAWHNGVHIQAPAGNGASLPVRAIADGKVIFVKSPANANADVSDPQNYNPFDRAGTLTAAWTDNGCIIIEHKTAIGGEGTTETEVVFYSLYMHLSALGRTVPTGQTTRRVLQAGDAIWRKDEIGTPGQVYGHTGQIHFEICFDATNLKLIMGRAPNWVAPTLAPATLPAPTADGRTDSIFGSLYFYLPATTPTDTGTALPANHIRRTDGTMLGTAMWVKMNYEKGDCSYESFDECGAPISASWNEADAEYNLYSSATTRHNNLPAASQASSSPSGWYELLRFGRNIGRGPAATDKDPLPANAAHWRRIIGPGGAPLWVDLNAAGSFKFSDADFPAVMGWNFIDDDTSPADQRCDSANLKGLIRDPDAENTKRMETAELANRLGEDAVRQQLRRTVCQFPSEWDKGSIATRYSFVKELEPFKQSPDAWTKLEAHLKAISFDALPAGYLAAQWRMHPKEFIRQMRKCGWLSGQELVQCIPRNSPAGAVSLATARARIGIWGVGINRMIRKFGLDTRLRVTHLLAHVWAETGYLRLTREAGADDARYAPYIGRGLIQITWQDKYENYNNFARITPSGGSNFDLELIATNPYHAGNSSGFYWVSKDFKEPLHVKKINLSRLADSGSDTDDIGRLCLWINGGGNHYDHRHIHFYFIDRLQNDVALAPSENFPRVETKSFKRMDFVRENIVENKHPKRVIVGTERSKTSISITIDHTAQR